MKGVAFQSLFEYMRRTESQLVLPRVIREEVVVDYGRRLKKDAKEFEEVWRRYHHLDLSDTVPHFQKPDGKRRMKELRQKLMKPMDGVVPIYVPEITGAFIQEAFMRGIHRTRPANDNGEELRDVILWLWALAYSDAANAVAAFISNDGGFWAGEVEPHPVIDRDVQSKNGRFHIFRSIKDFLKAHAPAPVETTEEWAQQHFEIQRIEGELIDRALKELQRRVPGDSIQALSIKEHKIKAGKLYEVSNDSQFAELELQLVFKFLRISWPQQQQPNAFAGGFQLGAFAAGWGGNLAQNVLPARLQDAPYLSNLNRLLARPELPQVEPTKSEVEGKAEAHISLRIKNNETTEISVDTLKF